MKVLDANIATQIQSRFQDLKDDVNLILFVEDKTNIGTEAKEIQDLFEDLADIDSHIHTQVLDRQDPLAQKLELEFYPALTVQRKEGFNNFVYYGIPAGHEFGTLIEVIRMMSTQHVDFNDQEKAKLEQIQGTKSMRVFVTPTCPYCPPMAIASQQAHMVNPNIIARVYDSTSAQDIANHYKVKAVPKVVLNENESFEGSIPLSDLVQKLTQL